MKLRTALKAAAEELARAIGYYSRPTLEESRAFDAEMSAMEGELLARLDRDPRDLAGAKTDAELRDAVDDWRYVGRIFLREWGYERVGMVSWHRAHLVELAARGAATEEDVVEVAKIDEQAQMRGAEATTRTERSTRDG